MRSEKCKVLKRRILRKSCLYAAIYLPEDLHLEGKGKNGYSEKDCCKK